MWGSQDKPKRPSSLWSSSSSCGWLLAPEPSPAFHKKGAEAHKHGLLYHNLHPAGSPSPSQNLSASSCQHLGSNPHTHKMWQILGVKMSNAERSSKHQAAKPTISRAHIPSGITGSFFSISVTSKVTSKEWMLELPESSANQPGESSQDGGDRDFNLMHLSLVGDDSRVNWQSQTQLLILKCYIWSNSQNHVPSLCMVCNYRAIC